jgi:hypothetical protein
MDQERDLFCNYSDSSGRFYLSLPEGSEPQDLFLSAADREGREVKLYVDQDFSNEPVRLPSFGPRFASVDRHLLQTLSTHAQIREQYRQQTEKGGTAPDSLKRFFYGSPLSVIHFENYIRLPSLEEYFTELTPLVSVRRENRKKEILIYGDHPDLKFYAPLVLVDGVAIHDHEAVLSISPGYLDRIEIINAPYVKGNVTFGGIVNVVSKGGNMGYMDLPASGRLVRYGRFSQPSGSENLLGEPLDKIPDVRTTLLWIPMLEMDPEQEREISFRAPALSGDYELQVRGYDLSGRYQKRVFRFRVADH